MSTLAVNAITDSTGGSTATINSATPTVYNTMGKNRIINGAMEIDQRNAGASLTVNSAAEYYAVDRFIGLGVASDGVYTLQQVTDAPTGFVKSIKATVTTADASIPSTGRYLIRTKLEGNSIADFVLGSASAKTFTLSFYVKSSLTGTFGGVVINGAQDRSYPFTYTISSANTWEQKAITIAGDTTGTWPTDNSKAMQIGWSLGVGSDYLNTAGAWVGSQEWGATGETAVIATNGATFYITGVQLELGSTATEFERRMYGTELQLCQRYYQKLGNASYAPIGTGFNHPSNNTNSHFAIPYITEMRTLPSASYSNLQVTERTNYDTDITGITLSNFGTQSCWLYVAHSAAGDNYGGQFLIVKNGTTGYLALSAEL